MRALIATSLIVFFVLAGCKPNPAGLRQTAPFEPENLAVKHVYKLPPKNQELQKRFQDPQLHQLIALALHDAPNIRSAKARLVQARQVARASYATLWPNATLNGAVNKQHFSFKGVVPPPFNELIFDQATIANLGVNFNYELDLWGKNRETFASKLSEALATRMEVAETQLVLGSAVANAYFELQNSIIQQQLSKENVRLLHELEEIVLARAKEGIESDIPLKTAITNTQSARLAIEDHKRQEQLSRHQLAVLLGKNPFTTQIEAAPFSYHNHQFDLSRDLTINVLAQRPDIAATKARAESAAHQINVAKAAFYPDINLSGLLNLQSFYFSRAFHISLGTEGAKAALSLPIFDAGSRKATLGIKYAEYELAVNQYNQTVLNGLQEVRDQMATLKTLSQQIHDQSKAVHATHSNYQLLRSRYQAGIIDYVQLCEIKQALVEQKATLYTLKTRKKQAFVALIAALGGEISTK